MFLQTLIGVSGLMLLVLLLRRPVARHFGPRVAYALWLLPFARLVAPTIELPRSWVPDLFANADPASSAPPITPEMLQAMLMTSDPAAQAAPMVTPFPWISLAMGLWAFGCVAGLFWIVTSQHRHMRTLRRNSRPASDRLSADIERAVRLSGLSKLPEIRLSQFGDGPLVCGLLRPMIILPRDFEDRFTPEQRRLALLHEMLHVRRGDLWTASAMLAFRLISWPNPIVHWAWPRFRADQEAACDASLLRCTGETLRGEYAETLLTAVNTTGRASPASGAGLTLSLHHPVKERLMTLGSKTHSTRGTTRWALGALLLAGTAISAPLSFADDQQAKDVEVETIIETPVKGTTTSKNVMRWIVSDDDSGERKGFEIRETDGVKTYLRVSRDGTTEEMTREQLVEEYGEDFDKAHSSSQFPRTFRLQQIIEGEPGLTALSSDKDALTEIQAVIVNKAGEADQEIRVEVEDGVRKVYKVAPDGTETELNIDVLGEDSEVRLHMLKNLGAESFPSRFNENITIMKSDDFATWSEDGENSFALRFGADLNGQSNASRLRSAQSMLEMTNLMLVDVQENSDDADRELRSAEKELQKARKALKKALAAIEKSEIR